MDFLFLRLETGEEWGKYLCPDILSFKILFSDKRRFAIDRIENIQSQILIKLHDITRFQNIILGDIVEK